MILPILLVLGGIALVLVSLRGLPPIPRPKLSDLAPVGFALGVGLAVLGLTKLVLDALS